ncbi:MAG TPA: DUF3631 domain-containing protein, partial [Gemmatimonadales bacterium]|nr:DUF3631 domain-containing protein [Gemmatimonadales bacterium]
SLCLQLLSLLSPNPALTSGVTAATLSKRTDSAEIPTFLLDEAQVTLGSRARSKNPTLRGLLVSGFQRGIGYSDSKRERNLFAPKAFAGIGPLPEPLADRSLPIILDPLTRAAKVQRFSAAQAQQEASPIMEQLQNWAKEHLPALQAMRAYPRDKFPSGLSPRKEDMFEPLLKLADALGGVWPDLARKSLMGIFDDQAVRENRAALKLLDDIREAYVHYGRPHRLSTAAMIAYLHTLPNRPYNQEGPITDKAMARILAGFNIHSRSLRFKASFEPTSPHRGYMVQDFVPVWARLLSSEPLFRPDRYPDTEKDAKFFCEELERKHLAELHRSQHEAERKQIVAAQKLEKAKEKESRKARKPNNDAACSSVATSPQDRIPGEWEGMTEEQRAILAEVRRIQNRPPACAEREMQRVAPSFLRR